ncbi:MAG TPA: protein jag [Desulfotomaculum sp.]|nr:protein jag [Desulfotomaculum sp.]
MKEVVKSGKSVEEAVKLALADLGAAVSDVSVEVLSEPAKGLFGILGAKPAVVKVTVKDSLGERAGVLVKKIITSMGLDGNVVVHENERRIEIEINGDRMGALIGRRGETLNALQYLVGLAVNRSEGERKRVQIDVGGYRKKRDETLRELAMKLADKAKQRGRSVALEPMNPHERRVIHMALKSRNDIYTFSEGEEPFRKIVISPRK